MSYQELLTEIRDDIDHVERVLRVSALDSVTILGETSGYLLAAGGKRLRPTFVILAGKFFNYSQERLGELAAAIELIHMASLVHDDVIDGAAIRRGIPTVGAEWGSDIAIETGDYLFAQALSLIAHCNNQQVSCLLARISLLMCEGEIEQIMTVGNLDQSLRNYLKRIKRKTALLISACCLIGALAAEAPPDLAKRLDRYGYYLGMAFQITDDTLDFTGSELLCGKPVGNDLRQGIITLPVILAMRDPLLGPEICRILNQPEKTDSDWLQAIELVKDSRALITTRELSDRYIQKAQEQLSYLPDLPPRRIMENITEFIGARDF